MQTVRTLPKPAPGNEGAPLIVLTLKREPPGTLALMHERRAINHLIEPQTPSWSPQGRWVGPPLCLGTRTDGCSLDSDVSSLANR